MQVIPIALFSLVFIGLALGQPFLIKGDMPRWARGLLVALSGLIALGALAFFGPLIINAGGLLPDSVEWPVGHSPDALQTASGHIVVAHDPSGRVQVYEQNLNFVNGWHVDADGGIIRLELSTAPDGTETVIVSSPRMDEPLRYLLDGTLLPIEKLIAGTEAPVTQAATRSVTIPTRWWQWPLVHPFLAFPLILPGIFGTLMLASAFDLTHRLMPDTKRR